MLSPLHLRQVVQVSPGVIARLNIATRRNYIDHFQAMTIRYPLPTGNLRSTTRSERAATTPIVEHTV